LLADCAIDLLRYSEDNVAILTERGVLQDRGKPEADYAKLYA